MTLPRIGLSSNLFVQQNRYSSTFVFSTAVTSLSPFKATQWLPYSAVSFEPSGSLLCAFTFVS